MTDQNTDPGPASDPNGGKNQNQNPSQPPVDLSNMIPKSRFDEINSKRKQAEQALSDVAGQIVEQMVPENMRAIVPDLPAADKIKWVHNAAAAGVFTPKQASGPDSKRPGDKPPESFEGLSPQSIMSQGYGVKK